MHSFSLYYLLMEGYNLVATPFVHKFLSSLSHFSRAEL